MGECQILFLAQTNPDVEGGFEEGMKFRKAGSVKDG